MNGTISFVRNLSLIIDPRAGMIKLRFLGKRQHEPEAITIKKSQLRRYGKEVLHAQLVLIEIHCSFEIVGGHRNLSNRGQAKGTCFGHLVLLVFGLNDQT